ncbi:MAG TPA: tRNA guanosine(34) transglycosylase Tgt [Candidatus Bipolaricaulota bacterium]|nr:tRNA guanosine(34) transglycosylase Tgt [Candidatus Bipolaricaulota bacterium]
MIFKKINQKGKIRLTELETEHGKISGPFFMPIATKGALKHLTYEDLTELQAQIILSNTYHLLLKPGQEIMQNFGGLHKMMKWDKPILTDSGGFQVFSLAKIRKLSEKGVEFSSHIDGSKIMMTPEKSIEMQMTLGSDIMMVLDVCTELPATKKKLEEALELTYEWAKRCKVFYQKAQPAKAVQKSSLFGIIQGGTDKEFRLKSIEQITSLDFDGYAIGGLAVGESAKEMYETLDFVCPKLPEDKPRYLMGVGKPENIVEAVKRGIDMFDCVIPTREARHGRLYLFKENIDFAELLNSSKTADNNFYYALNIKSEPFKEDFSPINPDSKFEVLRNYSKAYLRHLFDVEEPMASRLATLNNLEFYLGLMKKIRESII